MQAFSAEMKGSRLRLHHERHRSYRSTLVCQLKGAVAERASIIVTAAPTKVRERRMAGHNLASSHVGRPIIRLDLQTLIGAVG